MYYMFLNKVFFKVIAAVLGPIVHPSLGRLNLTVNNNKDKHIVRIKTWKDARRERKCKKGWMKKREGAKWAEEMNTWKNAKWDEEMNILKAREKVWIKK